MINRKICISVSKNENFERETNAIILKYIKKKTLTRDERNGREKSREKGKEKGRDEGDEEGNEEGDGEGVK